MLDVIKSRYSCRSFSDKVVEMEKIHEIINAGLHAPSGKGNQDTVIIAITDKEKRDKYVKLNAKVLGIEMDTFYNAPVIIVVLSKNHHFAKYDGSAALENMLLEAKNQGLDTCWIFRAEEVCQMDECQELFKETGLNLKEYVGISNIALGYANKVVERKKKIDDGRYFII